MKSNLPLGIASEMLADDPSVMWLGQPKAKFLSCAGKAHLQGESAESTAV